MADSEATRSAQQAQADASSKSSLIGSHISPKDESREGVPAEGDLGVIPLYIVRGLYLDEIARRMALLEEPQRGYWWDATEIPEPWGITLVQLAFSLSIHNVRPENLFKGMKYIEVDYDKFRTINLDDLHLLDEDLGTLSSSPQFEG